MPKVIAVHLRYAAKNYWFDPNGIEIAKGDHVIVETARGQEIGICVEDIKEVAEEELAAPLKPVLRIANDEDFAYADELAQKSKDAFPIFCEMVKKNELDMKPIKVEFVFSGDFATFYFSAEERVDFRTLVRDLASQFHVRIDMRQIGVRDEARILGGIGHCGEELCCHRFGAEVQQVSIRMAKEQDLPLSSNKISGQCGRLMCCLRYELEAYQDFKERAPKKNALIDTPLGMAKVIDFNTPEEIINLRLEDGQSLSIPLSAMDTKGACPAANGEAPRPCHISQESLERVLVELKNDKQLALMADAAFTSDKELEDVVATNPKAEYIPTKQHASDSKPQPRRQNVRHGKEQEATQASKQEGKRVLRKRRSISVDTGAEPKRAHIPVETKSDVQQTQQTQQASHAPQEREQKDTRKPRRRSRHNKNAAEKSATEASKSAQSETRHQKEPGNKQTDDNRQNAKVRNGNKQQSKVQSSKPRPGQHSSSLSGNRQRRRPSRNV